MASSSKKRTTMAKLARESKLRERRAEKQARKDARRQADPEPPVGGEGEIPALPDDDAVAPAAASGTSEA